MMEITGIEKLEQPNNKLTRELKLKETSRQMEASFLTLVFKAMEKTIPKSSLIGGSNNSLASMMFSTTMADAVAEQGGLGFADKIFESLKESDNISDINDFTRENVAGALEAIQMMNFRGFKK